MVVHEKKWVFFFFGTYLFSVHFFVFIKDIILSNFYVKCAKKKLKFNLFWNAKKLDLKKYWDRKWKTKPFPTILNRNIEVLMWHEVWLEFYHKPIRPNQAQSGHRNWPNTSCIRNPKSRLYKVTCIYMCFMICSKKKRIDDRDNS